ncbi:hypothetical protein H6F93_18330 [Leptolyngbya sp. FACHB-671]|uniref:hypothetical protein n=1 Tax=Leptolyngbya sp. FACHB-671 TaxID=2692812 RepID=UPI001687A276|nr:hypothetical protein [Leptolyngbya sp. FACHB-671]MBD2069456.1 hypothetical protein [Leptolyngbya sp. FACHB-671]
MDDRLTQLVQEAQLLVSKGEQSPVQLPILTLVDEILRSRPVGRALPGQPLSEVYQKIFEHTRNHLLDVIVEALSHYNSARESARDWAIALQTAALKQVLDDVQLKQLAMEAQRHPCQTVERQHALTQLVTAIKLSGRLARPHRTTFTPSFYELLYDEAVNRTLTYICCAIDNYDPERGDKKFMNWVNFRLERVMIDCRHEFSDRETTELPNLNDLEHLAQPEESDSPVQLLRDYIEQDAEQVFRQTHIRDRPDANFRNIALDRFDDKSWEDISVRLGIKIPTLSSFFQRCCQKFAPKFQEHLFS